MGWAGWPSAFSTDWLRRRSVHAPREMWGMRSTRKSSTVGQGPAGRKTPVGPTPWRAGMCIDQIPLIIGGIGRADSNLHCGTGLGRGKLLK
jgi:hypothetical protein